MAGVVSVLVPNVMTVHGTTFSSSTLTQYHKLYVKLNHENVQLQSVER